MSVEIMGAVFKIDLPANEKLVLLCLADYADGYGGSIYPSVASLAQRSSLAERTVQRYLSSLKARGLLLEVVPATATRPPTYRLNLSALAIVPERHSPAARKCPPGLRLEVIEAFGSVCQYCQRRGEGDLGPDGRPFHVDRIIPGSRGGNYSPENVTLSCAACNSRKRDREVPTGTPTLESARGASVAPLEAPRGANDDPVGVPTTTTRGATVAPDPSLIHQKDPITHSPGEPREFVSTANREAAARALASRGAADVAKKALVDLRLECTTETFTLRESEWLDQQAEHVTPADVDRIRQEVTKHGDLSWPFARRIIGRVAAARIAGRDPWNVRPLASAGGGRGAVRSGSSSRQGGAALGGNARVDRGPRATPALVRKSDQLDDGEVDRILAGERSGTSG